MYMIKHGTSATNSRNLNKHVLLDLVRFARGGISRAELARQMDLSRAAITGIVNDMLALHIVREASTLTAGAGRRPIMLEIDPARGYVLGVDLAATHLELVLADFAGRIITDRRILLDIRSGPQACLATVENEVEALLRSAGITMHDICSAGIGVPGPVIISTGSVRNPPLMPGWDNFPIRRYFEDRWLLPVSLNNDAELGVLGEWAYGAARGENHVAYIKVGTGIGAGLMLDGRIYRGVNGTSGEIGHITIHEQGAACACGNFGCLEAVAGGRALAQQAIDIVASKRSTLLAEYTPIEQITAREIAQAAMRGDFAAQQIIADAGAYLGIAVASLVNLINPGMVVIGGGLAQMGDLLLEPVRHAVQRRSLSAAAETVRIVTAVLGQRSTSMGAVSQALDLALHQMIEN